MQLLELTVQGWLEELGERGPAPGGGSAAAITAAMAAALVGMAARLSAESWSEAGGICAQTWALRVRLAGLAQADADDYGESLRILEGAKDIPAEYKGQPWARGLRTCWGVRATASSNCGISCLCSTTVLPMAR